jgi:hypothetical protein
MTELTHESLEQIMMDINGLIDSADGLIAVHPTQLIVPYKNYRFLMWVPPAAKRKGIRGRKRALMRRGRPRIMRYFK